MCAIQCRMSKIPVRSAHMGGAQPNSDHLALYLAAEQRAGYFAAAQARQAGFSRALLSYHVGSGRFVPVRPHVYRLAQIPASSHADLQVARLEAGPQAVISHDSALALYGLSDLLPAQSPAHTPAPHGDSAQNKCRTHVRFQPGQPSRPSSSGFPRASWAAPRSPTFLPIADPAPAQPVANTSSSRPCTVESLHSRPATRTSCRRTRGRAT